MLRVEGRLEVLLGVAALAREEAGLDQVARLVPDAHRLMRTDARQTGQPVSHQLLASRQVDKNKSKKEATHQFSSKSSRMYHGVSPACAASDDALKPSSSLTHGRVHDVS